MNKTRIILAALIVAIICVAAGVAYYLQTEQAPTTTTGTETTEIAVTLTVQGVYDDKEIATPNGISVVDLLEFINRSDESLLLSTKEYSGLGILVESMGELKNGTDNKYWQYFVNNEMPQVGADQYELKDGDDIEWRFTESQF